MTATSPEPTAGAHLPEAPEDSDVRELRLALVCYGGVSLAIYMHGITKELEKLARASAHFATIFSGNELGSGFVAWHDDSSSYVITAKHVVAHNLGGFVRLQRAGGGSWQGEIVAEDGNNDLAVIRLDGHPAGA